VSQSQLRYEQLIRRFLSDMANVGGTQREYYDALRFALSDLEIDLQACKETLDE
jgi:hypothetical protein